MSYTSFLFFVFLAALAAVYFVIPLAARWVVLLVGSLVFYWFAVKSPVIFLILIAEAAVAYLGGRLLESAADKVRRKRVLLVLLILVIGFLAAVKLVRFIRPDMGIVMPLGLSYYTFSSISYLLDVYWKRYEAEHNPLRFLLYIAFFPHIMQGPIPRFDRLAPQLFEGHRFEYERVCMGLQLMLYGLFQKLVIADRLGLFVNSVFDKYETTYGLLVVAAVFLYAIQLYMDFAGCVNIVKGVAEVFGIYLEDNFRQPYFATSVEEYWRRWHITLGGFFRDYVGMPVSVSKRVKTWSKNVRKKKGAEAGRNVVTLSALAVVWLCTGLWHGTGLNYLLWAVWQGGIIAIATVYKNQFKAMRERLHIRDDSKGFHLFQILRTFLLAGIIPRLITRAPSLKVAGIMTLHMFSQPTNPLYYLKRGALVKYGFDRVQLLVVVIAILIQFVISLLKERGVEIRRQVAGMVLPVRWLLYLALLFAVVLFGVYGPGYNASDFVYRNF